jgi:hypothetical protein
MLQQAIDWASLVASLASVACIAVAALSHAWNLHRIADSLEGIAYSLADNEADDQEAGSGS